jgi:SAM-dependent methyltransferase
VLEVACGTGMILLPLLRQGMDIYGFDLSSQMLDKLFEKAHMDNIPDIEQRISQQNMINFSYDFKFDAIFIPARSFLHLATQEDQIACLRNIHHHLQENGVLMLNFFTPDLQFINQNARSDPVYKHIADFQHPDGYGVITVSSRQASNVAEQIHQITWRFELSDTTYESPMLVRWIYKNEFQLLAKHSGFRIKHLYSGFDRTPYNGEGEMFWILIKKITYLFHKTA